MPKVRAAVSDQGAAGTVMRWSIRTTLAVGGAVGLLLGGGNAMQQSDDDALRGSGFRDGDVSAFDPSFAEPRTMMGWTILPPPIEEEQGSGTLTELERLSMSPSGVTFGLEPYEAERDNPLEPVSVTLRALDKITATYQDIEIPIGETAPFGPMTLLPRTCDKRPPDETPETTAFLEVYTNSDDVSVQRAREARGDTRLPAPRSRIRLPGEDASAAPQGDALFKGWMFASSPSLNAMEHPVYDVWVIDCKMVDPEI